MKFTQSTVTVTARPGTVIHHQLPSMRYSSAPGEDSSPSSPRAAGKAQGGQAPLVGNPPRLATHGDRSGAWSHGSAKPSQPCDVGGRFLPTVWGGWVGALVNDLRVEG